MENYDHVQLDENEIEEALRKAREQKHYYLKRLEYSQSLFAEVQTPSFTAEQMFNAFTKEHKVNKENREVVTNLCYYFADDNRFIGNLEKGLLLYGAVGVGKTTLMGFFFRNQKQSFKMTSCRQVESAYATKGDEGLQAYFTLRPLSHPDTFGHRQLGECFDDLGTEPAVTKHYGTEKAAMTEVILNRYDFNLPFITTHITTNLKAQELEARYGSRAIDRMREMFNFIEFTGETSWRNKPKTE